MSARSFRRRRQREVERRGRSRAGAAAGAGLGATVLFAPAADAATFNVTTLADSGAGSLRQALIDANADSTPDQIVFQTGLTGTITLGSQLPVNEPVAIQGPGADVITVSGNDATRIFYVITNTDGADVTISGLTLADGRTVGDGGALYAEHTDLTIADSVLTGNEAGDVGGAVFPFYGTTVIRNTVFRGNSAADVGGAIFSQQGTIDVSGSTLSDNDAVNAGGGLFVAETPEDGTADDVVIRNSTFSGNRADGASASGGGIFLDGVEDGVVLERTTISGNRADGDGGGIHENSDPSSGLTIIDSTVSGNVADADGNDSGAGGGLNVIAGGPTSIVNSTFSGNSAFYGGGITSYNFFDEPFSIRNSTIVGNSSDQLDAAGGITAYGFDGLYDGDDTITLSSSIVARNTAPGDPDVGGNISGDLEIRAGSSLIGSPSDAPITTTAPNLTGDPLLGPLANNGGPTETHAPQIGSPVIDAGVSNGLTTDQRGAPRTFDAANVANRAGSDGTDIGSVELLPGGRLSLASCKGATENLLFAPGTAIVGTDANDVIVGTDANDNINSGKGKDKVCAAGGNDSVKAGSGKDNVAGQSGKDRLRGNGGNDKLQGNAGRDTLKGGGGKDTLKGGGGKDKLRGGPGKDKLKGGGGKDSERQ